MNKFVYICTVKEYLPAGDSTEKVYNLKLTINIFN